MRGPAKNNFAARAPLRHPLEFARRNQVDLIVLGAPRPKQQPLAWMRSVASGVTANAHCSVHVVRVPERPQEPPGPIPPAQPR